MYAIFVVAFVVYHADIENGQQKGSVGFVQTYVTVKSRQLRFAYINVYIIYQHDEHSQVSHVYMHVEVAKS